MEPLILKNGHWEFTTTRNFNDIYFLSNLSIRQSFDFAYNMTFGSIGEHRDHRTGGSLHRKNGEIFANTFQGKLAEFAFVQFFNSKYKPSLSTPDLDCWELGKWDLSDFIWRDKKIAIKSAKHFSNLLLLECNDWDSNGCYIPNNSCSYFMIVLVRIKSNIFEIMKQNRLLYSDSCEKEKLEKLLLNSEPIFFDVPGYIKQDQLKEVIKNNQIIRKGDLLGTKTKIDADNYYIQSGCLNEWPEVKK